MLFHKKNLILSNTYEKRTYSSEGVPIKKKRIERDVYYQGNHLLHQLDIVWTAENQRKAMFATIKEKEGTYIEFVGSENCELVANSLEANSQGIKLLNVRENKVKDGKVQSATVFIPEGKEDYFSKKVHAYLEETTKNGNPKNQKLVDSIEIIKLAIISSFWIGKIEDIPQKKSEWCEFWLWSEAGNEKNVAQEFFGKCNELELEHDEKMIVFPEKVVVLVKTDKTSIQHLLDLSSSISEIRRAPETAEFYTDMNGSEASEWIDDLKKRITYRDPKSYICILDTGINKGHPLLENVIADNMIQCADIRWQSNDHQGHGTAMAGVCEYYDLVSLLTDNQNIELNHRLESVKILPDIGNDNDPKLFGAITADATSRAEIANPEAKRVYCMAVTADKYVTKDGSPSSWSAEIDKIIAGVEDDIKKLFVISAGNVTLRELEEVPYTDANVNHPVEDPGQAWNALTIGAYTEKIEFDQIVFKGYQPIADVNQLSPFSSTSLSWDGKWPIKPDVLFEGGNAVSNGVNTDICDEMSMLTTNRNMMIRPFTTINGTSSAAAQAANVAARLIATYPELWEETIRGLIVHSAEWTEKMKKQFCLSDKKTQGRRELLRTCGYGVASLERAIDSMNNSVNMIIQAELQPYCRDEKGEYKTNEMHLHTLPWPKDLLETLGETPVSMKVTLSYYIEPAPDQKGWNNKYRYSSSGLRFEVINKNQNKEDFMKRVNKAARGKNVKDKGEGDAGAERWFLGKDNRDVGSVHSDAWNGSAVDLAECKYVAIYPVIGWWRERHNLGMYNKNVRYALILTLSTPDENIDFYTPIETIISTEVKVPVVIEIMK